MGIYYKKMSFAETFWGQNELKTSYKFVRTTFDDELKAKCLRQSDESDVGKLNCWLPYMYQGTLV